MTRLTGIYLVWGVLGWCIPMLVSATNGMNMIGYNARSSGVGGADVALESDCPGCNPAVLGGDAEYSLSGGIGLAHPPVGFENGLFGPNAVDSDGQIYPVPYAEYAQHLGSGWTLGLSMRAQGGIGVDFEDVRTFAGNLDGMSTNLQVARLAPALSYKVNENLSIGGALTIGYSKMDFELFPETYSPGLDGVPGTPDDFAGMKLKNADGVGYAGRIGLLYRVNDRLNLGLTYVSEAGVDMDGGELTLNLGAAKVGYDARIEGFSLPREAEFGISFMATPKLRLVADVHWIDWASAAGKIQVRGANPNLPVPLQNPELVFKLNWEEQWVYAIGAEYALNANHTLRVGYNYGESPVPDDYVVPLFPGTVEHHLTLGYAYTTDDLRVDLAWEHSLAHTQHNSNLDPRDNPFGPDSRVIANPGDILHMGLTYWF